MELGLPDSMVYRQPFPGPGLGVRCLGAITRDRLEAVRESDAILREEFQKAGLDQKVWQYFTVVPDFKSVGVRDGARSFEYPVIFRAINTIDAMEATVEPFDWRFFKPLPTAFWRRYPGLTGSATTSPPNPRPPSSGNKQKVDMRARKPLKTLTF